MRGRHAEAIKADRRKRAAEAMTPAAVATEVLPAVTAGAVKADHAERIAPLPARGTRLYRIRQQPRPVAALEPQPEPAPVPAPSVVADYLSLPVFRDAVYAACAKGLRGLGVRGSAVPPLPDYRISEHLSAAADVTRLDMQAVEDEARMRLRGGTEWPAKWYRQAGGRS